MSITAENSVINHIETALQEIKHEQKQIETIDDILAKHKIPRGTLIELMLHPEKLNELPNEELVILSSAIHQVTGYHELNPEEHFSKREIDKSKRYKRKNGEFEYPYTFNGVLKSSDTEYVAIVSYSEVKMLWDNQFLTYNLQSQRLPKRKFKKDGTVQLKEDVNLKSVKKITELMLSGEYKSNALLFNILVDGNDHVEYDEGDLTVYEGTTVNLIDGMHRVQAAINALDINPELEGNFPVIIRHLPLTEAQNLLSQVNTVNPFDKTLTKFYGNEKLSAKIARDVMNIPELRDRISIKTTISKKSNDLTNFSILSETIEEVFEPQTTKDRFDIVDVLKKFFGYLIGYFEDEFVTKFHETREKSWINHHNTFVGYIVIAKKLYDKYGKDYPVDKIAEIVNSINFDKQEGLPYHQVISPQGKVNSNQIKKNIRKFFEENVSVD